jgi:hypothetical protein
MRRSSVQSLPVQVSAPWPNLQQTDAAAVAAAAELKYRPQILVPMEATIALGALKVAIPPGLDVIKLFTAVIYASS